MDLPYRFLLSPLPGFDVSILCYAMPALSFLCPFLIFATLSLCPELCCSMSECFQFLFGFRRHSFLLICDFSLL